MGASIGGKIVTDGLVIHYDGLNPRSYPGSGTTWNDLTPYNNSGVLDAGTTPTTITNGYASFIAGDDSCVDINSISEINEATPKITVDMWAKINPSLQDYRHLFGWNTFFIIVRSNDPSPSIGTGANLQDLYGTDTLGDLGVIGKWAHYSIVMVDSKESDPPHAGLPISDNKIYINSLNQFPLTQLVGSSYLDKRLFSGGSTSNARIGGFRFTSVISSDDLEIALVKVYNRELTQDEVTQNFNAHKGRFNIY
jgi:hypothetical protein